MLAARDAMHAHAYEEAAEHCRRVLEDLGDDAGTARCEARLELAAALEQAGEVEDSRAAFAEAARDARALRDAALLSTAALGFAKWQLYGVVDHEAVELLEDALAALPTDDDPVRASVLGLLAARLDPEAEPARRERLLAEAVAMARRLGDPETLAGVLRWMPYVASAPGAHRRAAVRIGRERAAGGRGRQPRARALGPRQPLRGRARAGGDRGGRRRAAGERAARARAAPRLVRLVRADARGDARAVLRPACRGRAARRERPARAAALRLGRQRDARGAAADGGAAARHARRGGRGRAGDARRASS